MRTRVRLLRPFFQPESGLLDRKLDEHRAFSAAMSVLCALTGGGLWIWDRALDPVGAGRTFGLRLAFPLLYGLFAVVVLRGGRRTAAALGYFQVLCGEVIFLLILTRLRSGMVFGLGGFMYFFLVPLVLFQGFSLRSNLLYTLSAALLPHAMAFAGLAPGLSQASYAALIWPAAFLTGAAQAAFARNYLGRYLSERRLERASNTDPLTGVSNRRHFMPLLAQEITRCRRFRRPLALLMIDIDCFKRVNDTYGHPTGDAVIHHVAETCRALSRGTDVVARLGGEEFAILLPESDLAGALAYAERLREDVERMAVLGPGNASVRCTVSIGVACAMAEEICEDDLLRRADRALYGAKEAGRNRICSAA